MCLIKSVFEDGKNEKYRILIRGTQHFKELLGIAQDVTYIREHFLTQITISHLIFSYIFLIEKMDK